LISVNAYIDSSAFVKLISLEAETDALLRWLGEHRPSLFASELLRTEVVRAVRRFDPNALVAAKELLLSVNLLAMPSSTFARAAELDPQILRSLDALHLASALELGDDLDVLVTYDDRLAEACALHGVAVVAP
jgi:uncharacterized protein